MNRFFLAIALLVLSLPLFSQTAKTTWSDEFKMKKGSTDLAMVGADETGVYIREGHIAVKNFYGIGVTTRGSATLVKINKTFEEEYRNDFNKELKGKEFEDFFFLGKKAWVFASAYSKKNKALELFAAELDKRSGEIIGDWISLSSIAREENDDQLYFDFSYNTDSSRMVLVNSNWGKEKCLFHIQEFDDKMKKTGAITQISNEYEPKTYQLEDVVYTVNGNIVMVGRVYEFAEGKKKKSKHLEFKNYNIQLFDKSGSMIKEINTDIAGKWLVSSKVAQIPNKELVIAAFYSNSKKEKGINGMLVQRVNAASGDIISTSQKELTTAMITNLTDDDEEETKQERKEREKLDKIRDNEENFSKSLRFKNFVYTPDNGIVILAEKFRYYSYTEYNTSSGMGGTGFSTTTSVFDVYECGDLMMSKMDANGQIAWLHVLPKDQREVRQASRNTSSGAGISFFITNNLRRFNFPFYAGLGSMALQNANTLAILFNDHPKNETVLTAGQKVKRTQDFGRSSCMVVYLDLLTGKYTRKALFSNREQPTAMPRFGVPVSNNFYIIGKTDRAIVKSKVALAKIAFK